MNVPSSVGVRAELRAFVRTHHPDVGGDPAAFSEGLAAFRARLRQAPGGDDDPRFDAPIVVGVRPPARPPRADGPSPRTPVRPPPRVRPRALELYRPAQRGAAHTVEVVVMSATRAGMFVGLILGVAAAAGGLQGFFIALVLGVLGFVVGRVLDGELDVNQFVGRGRDR